MPKAVLVFNLPEEAHEFKAATDAGKHISALREIKNQIRNIWKYGNLKTEEAKQVADDMHQIVCDALVDVEID